MEDEAKVEVLLWIGRSAEAESVDMAAELAGSWSRRTWRRS